MDPLWWLIPIALAAGFIDSIVGGGGILSLPALLAAGVPPHQALGTNKVVGTGASSMATWQYARAGLVRPRLALGLFPLAVTGGAIGAIVVLRIPEAWIAWAIVVVVIAMVATVASRPDFGKGTGAVLDARTVGLLAVAVLAIAFYDGLLGPGTGNMLLFALIAITGMRFTPAAAHGRVFNFGSNIGALGWFAFQDVIDWRLGLGMVLGTATGAFIGSHVSIRHGERWIRPLFVLIALAIVARLLWGLLR